MSAPLFSPEKIFVEADAMGLPLAERIISRCAGRPVEIIPSAKDLIQEGNSTAEQKAQAGRSLLLCKNRGRFLEPCPGTKAPYRCCGYMILNAGTGCPLSCSYCVLQAYLNNPFITVYVNLDDMLAELASCGQMLPGRALRVGTGEYADSLALEHLTDYSRTLVSAFRKLPGAVLELKTKTVSIEGLLGLDHGNSVIVSWSLNAPDIADKEERGAAPVQERLAAAREVVSAGYRVGFHFDPVICYPGWKQGYREAVDLLARYIPPEAVAWVSIGSLRFMPRLKQARDSVFTGTNLFCEEFVSGLDGKMRYLQEIRLEMYAALVDWLRGYAAGLCIYYCMEHPKVWRKTIGHAPASNAELQKMLEERACPSG